MTVFAERLPLDGVLRLRPRRFEDARGWFSETWNRARLAEVGIAMDVVQDNQSLSRTPGTIRGLHFQEAPFAQAKLVRVLRGAILDVVVDLRGDSPTFGRWTSARLDAETGEQLFVPAGFAHGFCTLAPEAEVLYKVDAPWAPDHAVALRWDDPELGIAWPVSTAEAVLSDADRAATGFRTWAEARGLGAALDRRDADAGTRLHGADPLGRDALVA